jgi:hypothetical protein
VSAERKIGMSSSRTVRLEPSCLSRILLLVIYLSMK